MINFEIVNFPFLDGDVPWPLHMAYTFRNLFVLRERVLKNRNQFLTSKLLKQGYRLLIFALLLIDTINFVKF